MKKYQKLTYQRFFTSKVKITFQLLILEYKKNEYCIV